jgi:hypothetical protein
MGILQLNHSGSRQTSFAPCSELWRVPLRVFVALSFVTCAIADDAELPIVKHQITGLFCPEREKDLREIFETKLVDYKLVSIDYKNAEASFRYDPVKVFPGAKPEQIVERFDNQLRDATKHTFGVKPLRITPLEKLKLVEIPIVGLDCKACCLAAYEGVYKLKGVETATASFKEGKITALIDPEQTDQATLEMALKQRGVELKK